MTETNRQLPGAKGQWILCSECPPTNKDADPDGAVRIYHPSSWGTYCRKFDDVRPHEYWCPRDRKDSRPFASEPAPAASAERRFVQIACGTAADGSYRVCGLDNEGRVWEENWDKETKETTWKPLPLLSAGAEF
jgi:hypothetical protein